MKRVLSILLTITMMLSIAGSITVMNTQTAYARMGVDVNGNPAGNREIYQPTDDPVYYYQPPVDENGNHDYFGYPIYGDPQDITDEEFFGKWDVYTNRWTMEPYFSYDAYPGMELVQEAVKKGNYDAAKRELKEYYKTNAWKIGKKPSAVSSKGMDHLDALSRNIYAYSMISMTAIRGFNLPANEFGKVELNVLDEVDTAKALAFQEFNLMLASGDKFWTTGQYYSKDAADPSVRPVLRMIVNGVVREKVAYKDTTVVAGTKRKVNYGSDEIIEVQEHGYYDDCGDVRGTCDEDTKRSFVCFDISDIKSTDKITYAKVILTGRSVITDETRERFADEEGNPYSGEARDKLLWAIWYRASAWDEDTFTWASDFFTGDMGVSLLYRQPVKEVIAVKLQNSLWLMGIAWAISGLVGFVLGIISGVKKDTWIDKAIKGYSLLIASTPAFWLALLLLMVFAVWLQILPIGLSVPIGVEAAGVTIADKFKHAILPALTLSITGVSNITLHTREKMIEIMESDYVLFASARGESTWSIVKNHGLRNVILPAITLQFGSISEIFGGSVLVEQIFSYPGLGQAAVTAGTGSDVPLLLGITVISAAIVFGGNLIANILYGVVDPRIRRGGKRS